MHFNRLFVPLMEIKMAFMKFKKCPRPLNRGDKHKERFEETPEGIWRQHRQSKFSMRVTCGTTLRNLKTRQNGRKHKGFVWESRL